MQISNKVKRVVSAVAVTGVLSVATAGNAALAVADSIEPYAPIKPDGSVVLTTTGDGRLSVQVANYTPYDHCVVMLGGMTNRDIVVTSAFDLDGSGSGSGITHPSVPDGVYAGQVTCDSYNGPDLPGSLIDRTVTVEFGDSQPTPPQPPMPSAPPAPSKPSSPKPPAPTPPKPQNSAQSCSDAIQANYAEAGIPVQIVDLILNSETHFQQLCAILDLAMMPDGTVDPMKVAQSFCRVGKSLIPAGLAYQGAAELGKFLKWQALEKIGNDSLRSWESQCE